MATADSNEASAKVSTRKRRTRRGRSEGSVHRRADGLWVAQISCGFKADGKRRRKTIYAKTKADALRKLQELGTSDCTVDAGAMTVSQLLVRWLESRRQSIAPASYARYKTTVERDLDKRLGRLRLASIAPIHVEQLYQGMQRDGQSAAACIMAGIVLGMAMKYACRLKLIASNPVREIEKPRQQRRPEFTTWTKDQAATFLKAAEGNRLYALYVLALTTGARQAELFGLQWTDIDFDGGYLTVRRSLERIGKAARLKEPKTSHSRRRIDLPPIALDALHEHRKAMLAEGNLKDTVFVNTHGDWLARYDVTNFKFQPLAEAAGVPRIRFHDLRHTHATLLLAEGENIKAVSERLGHANITITLQVYAHVLPTMQKSLAETSQRLFG